MKAAQENSQKVPSSENTPRGEDSSVVQKNDLVLMYLGPGKSWLVRAGEADLHTHVGIVSLKGTVGKRFGEGIETSLGRKLTILRPRLPDIVTRVRRLTQIVYPKDMGLMGALTGLGSGDIVVECGTGSAALTIYLANSVRPGGKVYTFESRPEFAEIASKNLRRAGLEDFVELSIEDFTQKESFPFRADVAVIDVGDPWTVVPPMRKALKESGMVAAICPTFNQVEKLVTSLSQNEFVDIRTYEVLLRPIEVREGMTRPATRMVVSHSGFLTFGRKTL